jgi:DNA replication protein DnaC
MMEEAVTPSDLKRLDAQLDALHLSHVKSHYQAFATTAAQKQLSHLAYLAELIEGEASEREARAIVRRIRQARFPVLKTMEDFEWSWPKKINRPQIQNLFRLAFVATNTNVVFISTVGLGKTHIAIALGHAACVGGHSALFTTAVDIINTLAAAQSAGRLKREISRYLKPGLLVIDLGEVQRYVECTVEGGDFRALRSLLLNISKAVKPSVALPSKQGDHDAQTTFPAIPLSVCRVALWRLAK